MEIMSLLHGGKTRQAYSEVKKLKKIPSHVGLVIGEDATNFKTKIIEAVRFLVELPEVSQISVFFRNTAIPLDNISAKIKTYQNWEVSTAFQQAMKSSTSLEESTIPFGKRLDFVVIYARSSSLCNFFPWTMDLATFALAGPLMNICPYSLVQSLHLYEDAEQRFGK
jgi:hypothetical protein